MSAACIGARLLSLRQGLLQPRCTFSAAALVKSPWQQERPKACIHSRSFSCSTRTLRSENKVTVNFINRDGEKMTVKGTPGDSLLDLVIGQNLDIDGFGACEGTLACSTCHVILDQDVYDKLGPITDEEMDMLDLAYGLTETSRLGCQVCLTKSLDGITVRVPESAVDIRQPTGAGSTGSS